jgi:hypothetical protein
LHARFDGCLRCVLRAARFARKNPAKALELFAQRQNNQHQAAPSIHALRPHRRTIMSNRKQRIWQIAIGAAIFLAGVTAGQLHAKLRRRW